MADGGNIGQRGFGFGEEAAAVEAEAPTTREQRRSRRKRDVRGKTISVKRLPKRDLALGRLEFPDADFARPVTRADCYLFRIDCKACGGQGATGCQRCGGSGLHFVEMVGSDGAWRVRDRAAYAKLAADPRAVAKAGLSLRPCSFVSCDHNLYLDVSEKTGAIKINFPDLEPDQMKESCVLDVADRGGETLEAVGTITNLTRERIRQVEVRAAAALAAARGPSARAVASLAADDGRPGSRGAGAKRRLPVLPPSDDRPEADPDEFAGEFDSPDGFIGVSTGVFSRVREKQRMDERDARRADPPARPAPTYAHEAAPVSAFAGPAPAAAGADWSGRERALVRACERLGRFAADAALRAAGCAGESWMVARLVSAGLVRRDGDAYAWVGRAEAAE